MALKGDKASMLANTYPHKPLGKIQNGYLTCGQASALVIFKQKISITVHDTKCPH